MTPQVQALHSHVKFHLPDSKRYDPPLLLTQKRKTQLKSGTSCNMSTKLSLALNGATSSSRSSSDPDSTSVGVYGDDGIEVEPTTYYPPTLDKLKRPLAIRGWGAEGCYPASPRTPRAGCGKMLEMMVQPTSMQTQRSMYQTRIRRTRAHVAASTQSFGGGKS
jgi:hypothetical protein